MIQRLSIVFGILIALTSLISVASAQENMARITLSATDNIEDVLLNNGVLDQFYTLYPNVEVVIEASGGGRFGRGGGGTSLTDVETKMQNADVALVNSSELSVQATRADLFLDLTPLANADPTLFSDDYYFSVWQSYQWDNGVWGLPVSTDAIVMMYSTEDFDTLGLPYPADWWTIADLADSVRQLVEYDADGELVQMPLVDIGGYVPQIMISLMADNVVDETTFPSSPDFSNPQLIDMMTQWSELQAEGLVGGFTGGGGLDAPIIFGPSVIATRARFSGDREFVALPGGRTALDVQAFAVSSGTQHPDIAYELAKFLTQSPEVTNATNSSVPARRSLAGITTDADNQGRGGRGGGATITDSNLLAIIQPALDNGIAISEARFTEYIETAMDLMLSDGLDAQTALQEAEYLALDDLAVADEMALNRTWVVEPPVLVTLAPDEIVINFGINNGQIRQNNNDDWQAALDEFTTFDPQVGQVNIEQERGVAVTLTTMAETYDCFYMSSNAVQGADLSLLVSLDPLIYSDPNFDQFDFVGNVFSQVQMNDQTWAYPMNVQPEVMLYNQENFDYVGAFYPYAGWTVTDFENALRDLKIDPEDPAPFVPVNIGGTYMQLLLAAYGGIAIDYSTDPVTLNFTDETAVNAAQQVLNLAKSGYIEYDGLAGFGGNNRFRGLNDETDAELYNQLIDSFLIDQVNESSYDLTTFPQGTNNIAVAYDIGTAYISANTIDVDACYRLIQHVAQSSANLFPQMPARRSQISDSALANTQGQSAVDFYSQMDVFMSQPNVLLIPTSFSGGIESAGEFLTTNWLYEAFDNYVLEDADLVTELEEAQLLATGFQECIVGIPPYDPTTDDPRGYFEELAECATQVDPNLSIFGT
jgi:ABC-type glycerol-3-phosphate transport system substrate-binding protein